MGRRTELAAWRIVRAGGSTPNVAALGQRAGAFAAGVDTVGWAQIVAARKGDSSLTNWCFAPAVPAAENMAIQLAQSVAGNAQLVAVADDGSVGPDLTTTSIGWLEAVDSVAARETQAGIDPAELIRRLAVAVPSEAWVAFTLRPPRQAESRRVQRWYQHRLGGSGLAQHHSTGNNTLIMSCYAGSPSNDATKALLKQVASALPGFDIKTKARVTRPNAAVALASVAALGTWAGLAFGAGEPVIATVAGAVPASVALAIGAGLVHTGSDRLLAASRASRLPRPPRRRRPPRRPHAETEERSTLSTVMGSADGDYPLASRSFLVGPSMVVGLAAPHAGAASGASATDARPVPASLTAPIGPFAGRSDNKPVHLPAASAPMGTAIVGAPGTGKSLLLRAIWAWSCVERVTPSGRPGWPGSANAMVAFESKGDGAGAYLRWAEAAGDVTVLVDVADPSSWAIDLLAVKGNAAERAEWFANALVYAFGSDAIQDRSFDALNRVLTAALAVTNDVAAGAGLAVGAHPVTYAYALLGGYGDAKGLSLATAVAEAAIRAEREAGRGSLPAEAGAVGAALTDLGRGAEALGPLYGVGGGKAPTESARRTLCDAPRNKLSQLVALEGWWAPRRRQFSWDTVLDGGKSVVVNTGSSASGRIIDDRATQLMSSLLMYGLQSAIKRRCSGWDVAGRSVSVFADELSLVAGSSPEIITWLRNQGRAYGVRPIFATQYPEQLRHEVRTAFMSFGTLIAFAQQNATVVADLVADLTLGGDEWSPADLSGLERYHAIVRTTVAGQRQPTVPIAVPFFEAELDTDPAAALASLTEAGPVQVP